MSYQSVFKRYELKYMLTLEQKQRIVEVMNNYMALDKYGRTTIRNIYFDTDNFRLIRRSIEKPAYKEKLRIRSYTKTDADSPVFVELKKKYKSVVYKRRLSMEQDKAFSWVAGDKSIEDKSQISQEIDYFLTYYKDLKPKVFLSYEREAYYALDGGDFRVTFDDNILCRQDDLSLEAEIGGTPILEDDKVLMEIKCSGGIPLWMTEVLSREQIYKTSFSKYGTAYKNIIFPKLKEAIAYV
ncbi:MAG: polyphosphate polymerase domain-containing protein [Lachnospiraceae bacterium]|nr:polyphosphate polymerase domain-containing protein [Lachnospiraceae bacterium]